MEWSFCSHFADKELFLADILTLLQTYSIFHLMMSIHDLKPHLHPVLSFNEFISMKTISSQRKESLMDDRLGVSAVD